MGLTGSSSSLARITALSFDSMKIWEHTLLPLCQGRVSAWLCVGKEAVVGNVGFL